MGSSGHLHRHQWQPAHTAATVTRPTAAALGPILARPWRGHEGHAFQSRRILPYFVHQEHPLTIPSFSDLPSTAASSYIKSSLAHPLGWIVGAAHHGLLPASRWLMYLAPAKGVLKAAPPSYFARPQPRGVFLELADLAACSSSFLLLSAFFLCVLSLQISFFPLFSRLPSCSR
ncbi:hypothetical protein F5884DRAFT_781916 [Xylogone sp. PMI_703]|nr:hypothetical protein F5884DRAFT_781916 [Xylogone sp. PMI_703]